MNYSTAKPITIDLNIGDQLTTISCGHIVVELIKFIAYQRLQIPYSYQWLKQIVNKRKDGEIPKNESFSSERHFHVASSALENMDFIIVSLLQEISSGSMPEEVCISLGASPITSKEVYRLLLPTNCHQPQCHSPLIASDQKIQLNVFKQLVTSETLGKIFFSSIPPTSTYIFIKKRIDSQEVVYNHDHFEFTTGHRIPRSSKVVVIDFRSQNTGNISCCNNYQVYGDVHDNLSKLKLDDVSQEEDCHEIESTDTVKWYQSNYVMKGFKDCIVDGTSVINSWFQS